MNELCLLCNRPSVGKVGKLKWGEREFNVHTCDKHLETANWMLMETIANYAADPIKKVLFRDYLLKN